MTCQNLKSASQNIENSESWTFRSDRVSTEITCFSLFFGAGNYYCIVIILDFVFSLVVCDWAMDLVESVYHDYLVLIRSNNHGLKQCSCAHFSSCHGARNPLVNSLLWNCRKLDQWKLRNWPLVSIIWKAELGLWSGQKEAGPEAKVFVNF